ncbi:hypothetical protein CQA53_00080 [Helicobacter didelphidarum]|uniref:Uncharacterized protein n=1 Tax=Helicobacter didelphidarum TaxID=2040648 RepID=A0A3D8IQA5_9HELI|nr:glucosyltransferase domain-containing protein [Helicobacter didelphidarum]RDU67467.1 hypothetical protein CQA53_00080 [Helicobacter didelphidarum]
MNQTKKYYTQNTHHKTNLFSQIFTDFKGALWAFFHTEGFWKYICVAFFLYLLGITAIIRADVYYIDDWGRSAIGYKEWDNFSRYISYFLSTFMHMDSVLSDIAPLTQFVAIGFLSFASVIVVWSIREVLWKNETSIWEEKEVPHKKRLTILGIIASLPIGLSPYFLEELSFRFDSPYMALSVLFSVIPFIFIHHVRAYIPVSILCSLGMCMTYQASSGIEIILVLFFGFLMLNQTNAGLKKTLIFMGVSMINYIIALSIFKFIIMHPFAHAQAGTATLTPSNFIEGFLENLETYLDYLWNDFGWSGIKISFIALIIFFILSAIYQGKNNKILSLTLSLLVIIFGISFSYGTYLLLQEPLTRPRAFIGIGIFTAIIAIYIVSSWRGWAYKQEDQQQTNSEKLVSRNLTQRIFFVASGVIVGMLSWSLIVFANMYGNALAKQKEYQNFRITILLSDLANAIPKQVSYDDYLFRVKGWVTASPVLENSSKSNRIMKRLALITDGKYWIRMVMKHYGWGEIPEEQWIELPDSEDPEKIAKNQKCIPETAGKLIKRVNNIYHKIEVYPHCAIITFKGEEKYTHKEIEEEEALQPLIPY